MGEEVAGAIAAGADSFHFDAIDSHYVPNLIVGPVDRIVAAFARAGERIS